MNRIKKWFLFGLWGILGVSGLAWANQEGTNQVIAMPSAKYQVNDIMDKADRVSDANASINQLPASGTGQKWVDFDGWYYLIDKHSGQVKSIVPKKRSFETIRAK